MVFDDDRKQKKLESAVDDELLRAVDNLSMIDPAGEEYEREVARLESLANTKSTLTRSRRGLFAIDPNEMLRAGASLVGLFGIMIYENRHVIGQHALQWVRKL